MRPPRTIKSMLYDSDVPVAESHSPLRTFGDTVPLRPAAPLITPQPAPMMKQHAALQTSVSSGAAGIGARSRFATAFRKITGSLAPGDESVYGEVVDLPSIQSSSSNSINDSSRTTSVPLGRSSAVPSGGKLSNPYSEFH